MREGKVVLVVGENSQVGLSMALARLEEVHIEAIVVKDNFPKVELRREAPMPIIDTKAIDIISYRPEGKPKKNKAQKAEKAKNFGKYSRYFM